MAEELKKLIKDNSKLLEMAKGAISAMDKNHDGKLDKNELKLFVDKNFKDMGLDKKSGEEEVQKILEKYDSNKNGAIDLDEMVKLLKDYLQQVIDNM